MVGRGVAREVEHGTSLGIMRGWRIDRDRACHQLRLERELDLAESDVRTDRGRSGDGHDAKRSGGIARVDGAGFLGEADAVGPDGDIASRATGPGELGAARDGRVRAEHRLRW